MALQAESGAVELKSDPHDEEKKLRLEMYKIADENHRFYVDKRFKIISLYYPSATLVLTTLSYFAGGWYTKISISIMGVLLTIFLYSLESRNWILTDVCSRRCAYIGKLLEGEDNVHVKLSKSYNADLPEYSTCLDKLLRLMARSKLTQHRAVSTITLLLVIWWVLLVII
jgi:hypothetical protein